MKVSELIKQLSEFPAELEVMVAGIFDADEIPKADDWSEDENIREVESDEFDLYLEDTRDRKQVVIQFFKNPYHRQNS